MLVLVEFFDGGAPHEKRDFSILPVACGGIVGGVTIFLAVVVIALAALVPFLLPLSSSLYCCRC